MIQTLDYVSDIRLIKKVDDDSSIYLQVRRGQFQISAVRVIEISDDWETLPIAIVEDEKK